MKMVQLLLREINKYYIHYQDAVDSDIISQEMKYFLAIVTHAGLDVRHMLKYSCSTLDWLNTPFYINTLKKDNCSLILRYRNPYR
jgi:hypothetical protein